MQLLLLQKHAQGTLYGVGKTLRRWKRLEFPALSVGQPNSFSELDFRYKGHRMARVTVDDYVDKVPNRFELVLLAAHRAREISGFPHHDRGGNDKNPSLRCAR